MSDPLKLFLGGVALSAASYVFTFIEPKMAAILAMGAVWWFFGSFCASRVQDMHGEEKE